MAGKLPARIWDPNKVFDISLEERKAVEERNRMRLSLKSEWQKKYTSPHKGGGGYIFDPAVQRFIAMRSQHFQNFKVTPKTTAIGFALGWGPILLLWWGMHRERTAFEDKCRTGQISYKDRTWKFI